MKTRKIINTVVKGLTTVITILAVLALFALSLA